MQAPTDPEMRRAAFGKGDPKSQSNYQHNQGSPSVDVAQGNRELALGAIRVAVHRLDEIRQELINAGLALKAGYITPQMAIDWSESFAPGCLGYLPPDSGMRIGGAA